MKEELERLKNRLFMLEMTDTWQSSDYLLADTLRNQIKELENNLNDKNR